MQCASLVLLRSDTTGQESPDNRNGSGPGILRESGQGAAPTWLTPPYLFAPMAHSRPLEVHMNTPTPARPRYVDLETASSLTGLSEKTLRRRISEGAIVAYRVGKRVIRIDEDSLYAFIAAQPIGNAK